MAKKTRKQKQRSARRVAPQQPTPAATAPAARAAPATARPGAVDVLDEEAAPAAGAALEEPAMQRRRIERVSPGAAQRPARARVPANAAAMMEPLDAEDAAIPFDRVPYVPSDLRRVAVMAGLMVLLIIVAAIVVSNLVH